MFKQSINWDYRWGQIVGRAWADHDFNDRLFADPTGVLTEYDVPPPVGVHIKLLENPDQIPDDTDEVMYLVLPSRPSAAELSDEELGSAGGVVTTARCGCGGCHHCGGCGGCGGCYACVWCYYDTPEPNMN
jgi:hypothetical protein